LGGVISYARPEPEETSIMAYLEIADLTVDLGGIRVLDGISLEVEKGEVAAVVGPNGAGKTTLLKAVLRLVPIVSGTVTIDGRRIDRHPHEPLPIGYVPQRLEFDRGFPITVAEFAGLRLKASPTAFLRTKGPLRAQVMAVLERVGADGLAARPLGELSGGQLQRALIAFALLGQPEILFLDEPLAGLDLSGEETLYQLVEELRRTSALTVIMVSHDLQVVYRQAHRVFCINRHLVCSGRPTEVLTEENLRQAYGTMVGFYEHDHPHH
jgi:zinc transport system ATP-binding protein